MEIYKYRYMPGHGYLVYRDIFDHDKCTIEEGAIVHKEATFVDEQDALVFCSLKNDQIKGYRPQIPWDYIAFIVKWTIENTKHLDTNDKYLVEKEIDRCLDALNEWRMK